MDNSLVKRSETTATEEIFQPYSDAFFLGALGSVLPVLVTGTSWLLVPIMGSLMVSATFLVRSPVEFLTIAVVPLLVFSWFLPFELVVFLALTLPSTLLCLAATVVGLFEQLSRKRIQE